MTTVTQSSEINRPENKGIASALNLLEESKKVIDSNFKGGPLSYASLHQFAATTLIGIHLEGVVKLLLVLGHICSSILATKRQEINRPENKGIASALNLLEESKKVIDSNFKGGPLSYASLHQFAETMF